MVELRESILDGKRIGYCTETVFWVQVGKGPKGSYRPRYKVIGSLSLAMFWFNGLNMGNGYKKRLRMNGKTLARVTS